VLFFTFARRPKSTCPERLPHSPHSLLLGPRVHLLGKPPLSRNFFAPLRPPSLTDAKPPSNMLFICKLNPVTSEEDLEIIFSR
jgi:hypothetical protein